MLAVIDAYVLFGWMKMKLKFYTAFKANWNGHHSRHFKSARFASIQFMKGGIKYMGTGNIFNSNIWHLGDAIIIEINKVFGLIFNHFPSFFIIPMFLKWLIE